MKNIENYSRIEKLGKDFEIPLTKLEAVGEGYIYTKLINEAALYA